MTKLIVTTGLVVALGCGGALAEEFSFGDDATGAGNLVELWLGGATPTGLSDQGEDCTTQTEHCNSVAAAGLYISANRTLDSGKTVIGDLTMEYMEEMETVSPNNSLGYTALGLHLVDAGVDPWGVFVMGIAGRNHADSDEFGRAWVLGSEKAFGNNFLQFGVAKQFSEDPNLDSFEDLFFVGGGMSRALGKGTFEGGLMIGAGDFDESPVDDDPSTWVQLDLTYRAPLGETGNEWFAGYRADYVNIDDSDDDGINHYTNHLFRIGITVPLGDKARFRSPELAIPLMNAGDLN